ncbi:hypothetical protein [Leptolyngbya sp. 7M]|uniref:hypothetical protein n=1 Tax=Leptolyngbya sp. 7M TaxID=2812896 RepID=UPI001B8CA963|nr:hypothetical protein [Leptolyngbya sp. 7M]QYO67859.1 hypothetical protein JVX88_14375 [Leptolyngbya sp. 7M]
MSHFDQLRTFRHQAVGLMGNGKESLFDLMDAVLVSRSVDSVAELSLSPVFRQQWSSLYESLQDSKPPRGELMGLYLEQMPRRTSGSCEPETTRQRPGCKRKPYENAPMNTQHPP